MVTDAYNTKAVTLGAAVALFVVLCVLPVCYMFGVSLKGTGGDLSFDNYRRLFAEPRQRELLMNSALLGAGVALLATALGAPLGLLLARTPCRLSGSCASCSSSRSSSRPTCWPSRGFC